MASAYLPPFHSSRQDQRNYRHGDPHFSTVSVGDADASTVGVRSVELVAYDGTTKNFSTHSFESDGTLTTSISTGSPSTKVDIITATPTSITFGVPIDTSGVSESLSIVKANVGRLVQVVSIETTDATPTILFDRTIDANSTHTIRVNVSFQLISSSASGSFSFLFRASRFGGTVGVSSMIGFSSILDPTLSTSSINISSTVTTTRITVIGVAGTVRWGGSIEDTYTF